MSKEESNGKSLTPKWLVGILIAALAGLLGFGISDQLDRANQRDIKITELQQRVTRLESHYQTIIESLKEIKEQNRIIMGRWQP